MITLTDEQKAIVFHPQGHHAKVLAAVGSGKTSTLVYRIEHLVVENNVNPASIQVLMFNRWARQQFVEKLDEVGILTAQQPKVNTFHSFANVVIKDLQKRGLIGIQWENWVEEREEEARRTLHRVVQNLENIKKIPPDSVDIEEAYDAIRLWKGSLITPDRAGYRGNPYIPIIYTAFEEERFRLHGLTYDDFIPLAVAFLERNERILKDYNASLSHLIVDEYQDVNYGQQRLVELLAGKKANVMVVGDDDQTIYEWRNARPNYIIREFEMVFDNKPLKKYKLSHSFRFGPVIAQCAYNTIKFNTNRFEKPLIAHHISKEANIVLFEQAPGQSTTTNKQLAEEIVTLKKYKKVLPKKIIVLGRMYAQLNDLQAEFMLRGIPFRVEGQRPFYERREIKVLLNYIRSAINYGKPVSDTSKEIFLYIANTPNRRLSKLDLARLMNNAIAKKRTLRDAIRLWIEDPLNSLNDLQQEQVISLMSTLERASKRIVQCPTDSTHLLLGDLVEMLDYLSHFDKYYGKGETSYDKKESVLNFLDYALQIKLPPKEFLEHIAGLDTTRGEPEEQQIVMTTVYKVKGLEYDYVFIPNCNEYYMPCLYESVNRVYDISGEISEPEPSETIENERRLFYVAITRAKEAVFIGAGSSRSFQTEGNDAVKMSRFIDEMQYEATEKVMTAFQQVASGKSKSVETLLKHTAEYGGNKSLINNLIKNYLSRLGNNSLLKNIVQITSTKPEAPFGYRTVYSKVIVPEKQESQKPRLHSAWDDVD